MADLRAYARQTAKRAGVEPETFVRQIGQESGFNPDAHNDGSGADGIAQVIVRWHPAMAGKTRDPIASLDYAADLLAGYLEQFGSYRKALAAYNWGSGNVGGYTHEGVTVPPWDGRRETLPAETRHYLDVILGDGWPEPAKNLGSEIPPTAPSYAPETPAERQVQDWACAIRTATWVLKSLGVDTDAGRMQDAMVPRYVTPQLGLLDARGYGLAYAIKAQLPVEWHGRVHVLESLGWDNLKAVVGRGPVALGGRSWGPAGHWTAVRRMQADGTLALANPAHGYQGVGDSLNRAQWDQLGPWSAVWVSAEPSAAAEPPADELATLRQQVVSLTAQLEDKARRLDTEVSKNGFAAGDLADALQAVVNTLRSLRPPAA